jgi:hypothetical protein
MALTGAQRANHVDRLGTQPSHGQEKRATERGGGKQIIVLVLAEDRADTAREQDKDPDCEEADARAGQDPPEVPV